jgi:hypothetical protein
MVQNMTATISQISADASFEMECVLFQITVLLNTWNGK